MPHKVNPIDWENAEGNLGMANALFDHFANKLPQDRLQRDLSDSTVQRNIGVAFGYSYLAFTSILKGLSKIDLDKERVQQELAEHPELLAEAIQTVLRRYGVPNAYELLKAKTQGKKVTLQDMMDFIDQMPESVPEGARQVLRDRAKMFKPAALAKAE